MLESKDQRRSKQAEAADGHYCIGLFIVVALADGKENLSGPSGNLFLSTRRSLPPLLLQHPLRNGDVSR